MIFPLVSVTLFFMAGILVGSFSPWVFPLFFFSGIFLFLSLTLLFRKSDWFLFLLGGTLVFAGGFSAQMALHHYPSNHISKWITQESVRIPLRGNVSDLPYRQSFKTKNGRKIHKVRVPFEVSQIQTKEGWKKSSGKIILDFYFYSRAASYQIGEDLELKATLKRLGQGGYSKYMRTRRILFQGSVSNGKEVISYGLTQHFWLKRKLAHIRSFLEKKLAYGLDSRTHRQILMGLVFGTRAQFDPELKALLMETNTYHIMAISGFNMALVLLIFTAFLSALGLPHRLVAVVMMGVILFYIALVGFPPSATRAGLMSLVALLGWALNREVLSLNTVAISAFLILLLSPMQLFMPGFQLSYTVVLGLIFWAQPLQKRLIGWIVPSQSKIKKWVSPFLLAFSVSCIAWLSVLPITLCTFGTFTLYSVITNLIIASMVSALTSLGIVALAVNCVNVNIGLYFNEVNSFMMDVLLVVLRFFQNLPGCYWVVSPLPKFIMVLFYFMLLYFLYNKVKSRA